MENLLFLAQDDGGGGAAGMIFGLFGLFMLALVAVCIIANWKLFEKAGKPGWACLIPFYNMYVMLQICGMGAIWFLAFFVPVANMVVIVMMCLRLAKAFGQSALVGVAMIFVPFIILPMLAFGDSQYRAID